MTDDAKRRRALKDDMEAKTRWLLERNRRTDSNGRITPEAEAEAREAAGLPQTTDQKGNAHANSD